MGDLLYSSGITEAPLTLAQERARSLKQGKSALDALLAERPSLKYEKILGRILEFRLVCKADLNRWLIDLRKDGKVTIRGMKKNERTPKPGHTVIWTGQA